MVRMDPRWIKEDGLFRPQVQLWPPQRHRAVLLVLATFVAFRLEHEGNPNIREFCESIRMFCWKYYQKKNRLKQVGNYLRILQNEMV
jgi:hypothetical protein